MTMLVSAFGIIGRYAGDVLMSGLSWASSLLFGRVPRSHQIYLVLMMAASLLWLLILLSLSVPGVRSFLLATTPYPSATRAWAGIALLVALVALPLGVGLAGYLVPATGERPSGAAIVWELLRGYLLTPLIDGLFIFLAGVGIVRKVRSVRHGWSDVHVPIVVKPGRYDQLVDDLKRALDSADLPVTVREAPWVLTLPARLLTSVAGDNVRKLRPDRLIELIGPSMRVGVYPSDIAISANTRDRTRARAVMMSRLATTAAHLTNSAEAQKIEERLGQVAKHGGRSRDGTAAGARTPFEAIDRQLLDLEVSTDEWDILYRMRLQIERDLLEHSASARPSPRGAHPRGGNGAVRDGKGELALES
jgi:hypothetical protein